MLGSCPLIRSRIYFRRGWLVRERGSLPCPTEGRNEYTRRYLAPPGFELVPYDLLQEVGEMTQITRKLVPMRGLILLLTVTLGAGLVLVGCGDDDTATTPAPAPPPPPPAPAPELGEPEPEPEPEPEAPATPTGLMVSATTETSITWTWDAVEGAIGYAVQVSADEMFDETDMIHPAAEATFTASPLPPETSVFVRVAAAGGTLEAPLLSAWTTHVTGTSAMPPPPPPAPMAPATPTGLMSESGEGSISWSWDAVEGADGYAVQVSMDEMFDDTDETTYTTETTHSVADLGYGEARFARVASTSGMGDDMLTSMWTTHTTGMSAAAPPPPPAPMAPAAPTGLTAESGDGSISWSWEAVEGADGYAVQVSMDEMFGDEETTYTMETTHSVADLGYAATRYARVASTSGTGDDMLMSAWTNHATGTSAMAPPPPPAGSGHGDVLAVGWTRRIQHFLIANSDHTDAEDRHGGREHRHHGVLERLPPSSRRCSWTDCKRWSAWLERRWQHAVRVRGLGCLLQDDVLHGDERGLYDAADDAGRQSGDGADGRHVLRRLRSVQVPRWYGSSEMGPPALVVEDSAACNAFAPTLMLDVGYIDNDGMDPRAAGGADAATAVGGPDGVDIGWTYTSDTAFTSKHDFADIRGGTSFSVTGPEAAKSSTAKALPMRAQKADKTGYIQDYQEAAYFRADAIAGTDAGNNICNQAVYKNTDGDLDTPKGCFRIASEATLKSNGEISGAVNYMAGYTVTLAPEDASVTWGNVDWEEDPFDGLTCDSYPSVAMDELDVCELLDDEVMTATSKKMSTEAVLLERPDGAPATTSQMVAKVQVGAGSAPDTRFKSLWIDFDSDGKITDTIWDDVYNQPSTETLNPGVVHWVHINLNDGDGDPISDIGKVDFGVPFGTSGFDADANRLRDNAASTAATGALRIGRRGGPGAGRQRRQRCRHLERCRQEMLDGRSLRS